MVARVEEVRKETEEIWKKFLKINRLPINDDEAQKEDTSHLEVQVGAQKDEIQTEANPEVQDIVDSQNPLTDHLEIMESKVEEAKATPKVDIAPSGDISAQIKEQEKDVDKVEMEKDKVQDKGEEVDKGKQKTNNVSVIMAIDTLKDKGKIVLSQISINFDRPLDIGQICPAERLMVATVVQAQASQDLFKSETEDKKLIKMSIGVL